MRIVSLIASATEIVAALGLADQLVGVSHECDWPPEAVAGRSVLTSPKLDITRSSLDIHKDVQKIVQQGLSVYNVDAEKLRAVKPDVIITQDQCEVCAVTYEDVVQATQSCLDSNAKIVTLHPDSLDDIFTDILKVGEALGVLARAEKLVREIKEKMGKVSLQVVRSEKKPRVLCIEWLNPIMIAGNWIPKLVEMAGGVNGLVKRGEHTKVVAWEEVKAYNPEFLLVFPCGFKLEQTEENLHDLTGQPGFNGLKGVKNRQVYMIDGNTYLNRPGPRILESLYILAGIFHPDLFKVLLPEDAFVPWGGSSVG